jgi:L-seryl-tRNA(Ser) seleniumtransferase
MASAADVFVELDVLQRRAGARIAELTGNEACFIASGAAAGVAIAVAACIAGTDPRAIDAFPVRGEREVIVQRRHRNGYDYSARMTGVRMVEIGGSDGGATRAELAAAITPRTAAVLHFAGGYFASGALPLPEVVEVAHGAGIPVIVDAAAQIPPVSNLRRFTAEGADLAVFSGGKALRGPQSTGLVLGRGDLVTACVANSSPRHSIGRPMKVGKEELLGIVAAIEWATAMDEAAYIRDCDAIVESWLAALADVPGLTVERREEGAINEPVPHVYVSVGPGAPRRDAFIAALLAGAPGVATRPFADDWIAVNPMFVGPDEAPLVEARIREEVAGLAPLGS